MSISVNSRLWGIKTVPLRACWTLKAPWLIRGFHPYTEWALWALGGPFAWFQSREDPQLAFILGYLPTLFPLYKPAWPNQTPGDPASRLVWGLVIADAQTINLSAPLILDPHTHSGGQIILQSKLGEEMSTESLYHVDAPLPLPLAL